MTITHSMSPLQKINEIYQRCLALFPDDAIISDVLVAAIAAAVDSSIQEPVWLLYVGAPSSGKTIGLYPFDLDMETSNLFISVSSITKNGLASGTKDEDGNDPSLLARLNNHILILKDLTALISLDEATVNKLLSDLRDAYDGKYRKASGMTGLTTYEARFGVIAAVTEIIDSFQQHHQQLGERFLTLRHIRIPLNLPQRIKRSIHVAETMKGKDKWMHDFQREVLEQVEICRDVVNTDFLPSFDSDLQFRQAVTTADLLALLRTNPINGIPAEPEMGGRLTQQLLGMAYAHCKADQRGTINETDMKLIRRVAFDTLDKVKARMLLWCWKRGGKYRLGIPLQELAARAKVDVMTLKPLVRQYMHNKIMETDQEGTHENPMYRLTEDVWKQMELTQFFSGDHLPTQTGR